MTKRPKIIVPLGYAVGTGEPVSIPLAHIFVTGQTQASGKTTTLQAIVERSGCRALAFSTKRGESLDGRRVRPYLPREGEAEIHWRFVETIMASALGQRQLKYERLQIINATKGARSLDDVRKNLTRLLAKAKGGSPAAGIYELLGEYLDLVLPEMRGLNATHELDLRPGLNVMDLVEASPEMQALAIGAAIGRINDHEQGVLTVFPEAWQFAPRDRNTAAKFQAEKMARMGAAVGNYLATDSQDIVGVSPVIRSCSTVWIVGVQREANELKRTLALIKSAGIATPKPADVATLGVGQFYVCHGRTAIKTYVRPAWMGEAEARAVAKGEEGARHEHGNYRISDQMRRSEPARAAADEERRQRDADQTEGKPGDVLHRSGSTQPARRDEGAEVRGDDYLDTPRGVPQNKIAVRRAEGSRLGSVLKGLEHLPATAPQAERSFDDDLSSETTVVAAAATEPKLDDDPVEYSRVAKLHDALAVDPSVPFTASTSRSVQRRVAAIRGEPAPVFDQPENPPASPAQPEDDMPDLELHRKFDTLSDLLKHFVNLLPRGPAGESPHPNPLPAIPGEGTKSEAPTPSDDEEQVYQRFKARLLVEVPGIAAGGVVTVTPPEKLRRDFQREEAGRLLASAKALSPLGKRVLKLLIGVGNPLGPKTIAERLGRPSSSGGAMKTLADAIDGLKAAGFADATRGGTGGGGVRSTVRDKIAADLTTYTATDAEVEAVYQTVVHEIATAGETAGQA